MLENAANQPLNLSYLTDMVGDNPAFIIEVLDTFLQQTPISIAEMEQFLITKNWEKLADDAHKIKPTFIYIGRADLKGLIHDIENNARNKINQEQIYHDFKRLKQLVSLLYQQLEDLKKSFQA